METPIAGESCGFTSSVASFNTPVEFLDSLKRAGIDFLSTANNHCLVRGIIGLHNTNLEVKKRGFHTSGSYESKDASEVVFSVEIDGIRISILCYTYGTNSEYNQVYLDESQNWMIDLLKKQAPVVNITVKKPSFFHGLKSMLPPGFKDLIKKILGISQYNSLLSDFCLVDSVSGVKI